MGLARHLYAAKCGVRFAYARIEGARHTHTLTGTRAHAYSFFILSPQVYGSNYNSTVAVLVTEVLKLPLTVALLCYEKCSVTAAGGQLWKDIAMQPMDTLKISIPALLYTVQNNALFVAVGHLEAAVFQVTYQLKTLTTAVLTVTMSGARCSCTSGLLCCCSPPARRWCRSRRRPARV